MRIIWLVGLKKKFEMRVASLTRKPVGFMQSCCPVWMTCGRHPDRDPGKYLPELPNFMQYYTWHHAHVIHTSSAHAVHTCHLHMSSAHVICTCRPHMSSAHVICTCHLHMSSTCAHHLRTSSTCTHVIRTSSVALLMVSVDLNYLSTLTGTSY